MATFTGTSGNDPITGGTSASDLYQATTSSGQNTFSINGSGQWVITGPEGTDTLNAIEKIGFVDGTISLRMGGETRVNTYLPYDQIDARITYLPDGGYVTTWASSVQDGSGYGIYMQRYDASGTKNGVETRVNLTTLNQQMQPAVATLDDGSYVVTWISAGQDGSGYGIYAQRYDSSGGAVGSETRINTTTLNDQSKPQVTSLSNGGYVITWQTSDVDQTGVFMQRFDSSGVAQGAETRVNTTTTSMQSDAATAGLSAGGFVVTWQSYNTVNGNYDIFFKKIGNDGAELVGETRVNTTTTGDQADVSVAGLNGGDFVITWTSPDSSTTGVFMQRFSASGTALGAETQVNTSAAQYQSNSTVTALADGGFVVAWESTHAGNSGIFLQRYAANGTAVGTETRVDSVAIASYDPSIAALADGGFIVTWESSNSGEVYSQRFDAAGKAWVTDITGNENNNVITYTSGSITLNGGNGNDTLTVSSGTNFLNGDAGDDILNGGNGADTLAGGAGADTLKGNNGNDTYIVDSSDTIIEGATGGIDTVQTAASYTMTNRYIENAILTGSAAASLVGNQAANTLTGNSADNTLNGGAGADAMIGGAGNDTYVVDNAGDQAYEVDGEGVDTVISSVDFTLGNFVEKAYLAGYGDVDLTGNELDNLLVGNEGSNALTAGLGKDILVGGGGNDSYVIDTSDQVIEESAEGIDTVTIAASYLLNDHVENLIIGGTGNFNGTGNDAANSLQGNAGHNILNGGIGADQLIGNDGNDTYYVDNLNDQVYEWGNGVDQVRSTVTWTLSTSVENLTLLGISAINGSGNHLDNIVTGNSNNNVLSGQYGADQLRGGGGNDTLISIDGLDTLSGGAGNDIYDVQGDGDTIIELAGQGVDTVRAAVYSSYTLGAGLDNLVLLGGHVDGFGNTEKNVITGTAGNNLLDGGANSDTMSGGMGNDRYIVDTSGDLVVEALAAGTDEIFSSLSWTLGANLENLTLTGARAVNGTGNALANRMIGNNAVNTLQGDAGNDVLIGGGGDDILTAGLGNDRLQGDAGNDRLDGGDGIDTAVYSGTLSGVTINLSVATAQNTVSAGTDTLIGIENVIGTYTGNDTLTGNDLNNSLTGYGGSDILAGGLGNDTLSAGEDDDIVKGDAGDDKMDGGNGIDLADYSSMAAGVTVDLNRTDAQNTVGAGIDLLLNFENVTGSATGDYLTGDDDDNVLDGSGGNDTLTGGEGNNTLLGGTGNDLLIVGSGNDIVSGGTGTNTVSYIKVAGSVNVDLNITVAQNTASGGLDTITSVVNVIGSNFDNDVLIGDASANVLNGAGGFDTMVGNNGNDTYYVDNAADIVRETNSSTTTGGIDKVIATASYKLSNYVENLELSGTAAINATGNSLANLIIANSGKNIIDGGSGADTLSYATSTTTGTIGVTLNLGALNTSGQATASGISGADLVKGIESLIGSAYADTFTGTTGDNRLDGGAGSDKLNGGAGNDTLIGGLGNDILTGSTGADVFLFNAAPHATTNADTIADFVVVDDTIQLDNAVFTKFASNGAISSGNLRIGTAAADSNDYLIYDRTTGALSYDADGSGAGAAVKFATLAPSLALTSADFFIV